MWRREGKERRKECDFSLKKYVCIDSRGNHREARFCCGPTNNYYLNMLFSIFSLAFGGKKMVGWEQLGIPYLPSLLSPCFPIDRSLSSLFSPPLIFCSLSPSAKQMVQITVWRKWVWSFFEHFTSKLSCRIINIVSCHQFLSTQIISNNFLSHHKTLIESGDPAFHTFFLPFANKYLIANYFGADFLESMVCCCN